MGVGDDVAVLGGDDAGALGAFLLLRSALSALLAGTFSVEAAAQIVLLVHFLIIEYGHHRGDHLIGGLLDRQLSAGAGAGVSVVRILYELIDGNIAVPGGRAHGDIAAVDQSRKPGDRAARNQKAGQYARNNFKPQMVVLFFFLRLFGLPALGRLPRLGISGAVAVGAPVPYSACTGRSPAAPALLAVAAVAGIVIRFRSLLAGLRGLFGLCSSRPSRVLPIPGSGIACSCIGACVPCICGAVAGI